MLHSLVALTVLGLAPHLEIRKATLDITPPEALPLGGYTERGGRLLERGGDHLFARALALSDGRQRVVILSAEMLTIPESLVRAVRAKLPADVKLFLAATHTHGAPDSQMLNERMTLSIPGIANYKRRWLDCYAQRLANCALTALRSKPLATRAALTLAQAQLKATHARRPGDKPDWTLSRIRAGSTPVVYHYAAHPIFYSAKEMKIRGDWPAAFMADGSIVLQGALGDVSPDMTNEEPALQIQRMHRLAMENLSGQKERPIGSGLGWREEPIRLDPKKPHPEFAKQHGIPQALAQLAVNQFAPSEASVSVITIGNLAVVGVPGEPTSALGRAIQDQGHAAGFKHVLVCSHVNGWIGYILDPDDYDSGGYEATLSLHGRETGLRVVEACARAFKKAMAPSAP